MTKLRNFLRKLLPESILDLLRVVRIIPKMIEMPTLASNYAYDFQKFLKYSAVNGQFNNQTKLRAKITMYYHKIEPIS